MPVPDFNVWFCAWCKSRELGGRVSQRFPCVTPVLESSSSDLLRAIIGHWTKSHLKSCQTSTMELFYKKSQWPKDIDYFRRKAPLQMLEWILNAPPIVNVGCR